MKIIRLLAMKIIQLLAIKLTFCSDYGSESLDIYIALKKMLIPNF